MSLLLDALKEAENRSRQGKADAGQAPAAPHRVESPPRDTALTGSHLTLADEAPSPTPASRPVISPPPPPTAPVAPAAAATVTIVPAAAARAPSRRWFLHAVLIALPLAAAALYVTLFRGDPAPLPALTPSMLSTAAPSPDPAAAMPAQADSVAATRPPSMTPNAAMALPPTDGEAALVEDEPTPASSRAAQQAFVPSSEGRARSEPLVIQSRPSPLADAHRALRGGDLAQAERLYRETLAGERDQPDAHLGLALIEQSRGATAAAMTHYRQVLARRGSDPQAWAGLADLAADAELDAMSSRLRTLIADQPDPALHFALGNLLARQARWPEAQESYFAAAGGAPQNADYAFNLAVALDQLGKSRAAVPYYARALALADGSRAVQFDTAVVRSRIAHIEAATP